MVKGAIPMIEKKTTKLILLLIFNVSLAACTPKMIPNTEVEDNQENRDIIAFCERYRHAVEDLNIGLLISLASPSYFDNSGTVSGDDDMDKGGLEAILKERFKSIEAIRYEIVYRKIYKKNETIMVEYTYTTSFRYNVDGKAHWENKTADNRLELEATNSNYLILSGM
jgi:hypothetical protein